MAQLVPKYYTTKDGKKQLSVYQAEFYDRQRHPARKRISLGTKDKRGAILKLAILDTKYLAGLFDLRFEHVLPAHGEEVIGNAKELFRPAIEKAANL